jgi:hypothetical protein
MEKNRIKRIVTFMNTNARSLNKKTELLVDNLIELECCLAAMTETWFKDSPASEAGIMDLCDGAGYTSLFRNRGGRRNGGLWPAWPGNLWCQ